MFRRSRYLDEIYIEEKVGQPLYMLRDSLNGTVIGVFAVTENPGFVHGIVGIYKKTGVATFDNGAVENAHLVE